MNTIVLKARTRNHRLTCELPASFPDADVEVIISVKSPHTPSPGVESLEQVLAWLDTQPPTGRSRAEIDAQIAEERDSWGDA